MTEDNFFDTFNRIHNPNYYYGKQKTKKKADDKEFNKMKLAYPVNEGWLYSKDKTSVKVFASYDLDPTTKEMTYGDRTMIPTTWIVKMTKIQ